MLNCDFSFVAELRCKPINPVMLEKLCSFEYN